MQRWSKDRHCIRNLFLQTTVAVKLSTTSINFYFYFFRKTLCDGFDPPLVATVNDGP